MTVAQVVFYVIAALAVGGALGVVLIRSTVYAGLFLILALLAVAGIYVLLASEFLALVQILIYGGAVTVLLLFALMLTRTGDLPETMVGAQWPVAALTCTVLFALLAIASGTSDWPGDAVGAIVAVPFTTVGDALFQQWAAPFEIASLVLLVALIGAIVIAQQEEGE